MSIIALDGPAGSGKSTVARAIADRLHLEVLDTGAMYRAVTWAVLQAGVAPDDPEGCAGIARHAEIEVTDRVTLDGADVSAAIRGPEVTAAVSAVSAHPEVRSLLVERQRAWVSVHGGGVIEGRDIGTVVFPDADVKLFLTADVDVRAERRRGDELAADRDAEVDAIQAEIERRDHRDSTRVTAPLRPAEDALIIDTTGLTVEGVIALILDALGAAGETG